MGLIGRARSWMQRRAYTAGWRARYWWMDTPRGRGAQAVVWLCAVLVVLVQATRLTLVGFAEQAPGEPAKGWVWWVVMIVVAVAAAAYAYSMRPDTQGSPQREFQSPVVADGAAAKDYFGTVWIEYNEKFVLAWKLGDPDPIMVRAGKSMFSGLFGRMRTKWEVGGHHFRPAFQEGLCGRPIDAYLEYRAADKTAWQGRVTGSATLHINKPDLFGGENDQGGIVGSVSIAFGDDDQMPNAYLIGALGDQVSAWRGVTTFTFQGGRFGAQSPYPQRTAHKVVKIHRGWDDDDCWYEETAAIGVGGGDAPEGVDPTSGGWRYLITSNSDSADYSSPSFDDSAWSVGASPFASSTGHPFAGAGGFPNAVGTLWPLNRTIWARRIFTINAPTLVTMEIFVDNFATVWINGHLVLPRVGNAEHPSVDAFRHQFVVPAEILHVGSNLIVLKGEDYGAYSYAAFRVRGVVSTWHAMNPAHMLYYTRTDSERGREPRSSMNDASLRAAADKLYAEGFGLCCEYDPASTTPDEFQKRIEYLIGGSLTRDLTTGEWHLDLARADYDINSLPILTGDDILEFKELPSTLSRAVNSISGRYFDVERKEHVVVGPARALALVSEFGEIHELLELPEIPTAVLAVKRITTELRARITPVRTFDLATTPVTTGYRPNTMIRLQDPKRRIADMPCLIGDLVTGTLKSGAVRMKCSQHVYSLSDALYIEIEQGVDTRPDRAPRAAQQQGAFELPYVDLVEMLPRAELQALPDGVGYLAVVAANPGGQLDYEAAVSAGADFESIGIGTWCPTASTDAPVGVDPSPVTLHLVSASLLGRVEIGDPLLWDGEIGRIDAVDIVERTVTVARGCADTVPLPHPAGTRLWFYASALVVDETERASGDVVSVKVLPGNGSERLAVTDTAAMSLTLANRQARPYPPADLRINSEVQPEAIIGSILVTWSHRDRTSQAGQLIDSAAPSVGPEPGTTYTARYYLNGELVHIQDEIEGEETTFTPSGVGRLRIEVSSSRDGLESWQSHVREFSLGNPLLDESGELLTFDDDQPILME